MPINVKILTMGIQRFCFLQLGDVTTYMPCNPVSTRLTLGFLSTI
jgi:hypothetical protein